MRQLRTLHIHVNSPVHPLAYRYVENQPEVLMQSPLSMQRSFCPLVPFKAQHELTDASGLHG
jgi:hypothetical protein